MDTNSIIAFFDLHFDVPNLTSTMKKLLDVSSYSFYYLARFEEVMARTQTQILLQIRVQIHWTKSVFDY